jgi:hypothetical protein
LKTHDYQHPDDASGERWLCLELRDGKVRTRLPPYCCSCLKEIESSVRAQSLSSVELRLPLCARCTRRWRLLLIGIVGGSIAAFIVLGVALRMLVPGIASISDIAFWSIFIAFCSLVSLPLVFLFGGPARVGLVARDAKTVAVRFRNDDFRRISQQWIQQNHRGNIRIRM